MRSYSIPWLWLGELLTLKMMAKKQYALECFNAKKEYSQLILKRLSVLLNIFVMSLHYEEIAYNFH